MNSNHKAFSLIELLVVITIAGLLMLVAFVPYAHYQKKAKLRIAGREISQGFYDAKSIAISGIKEYSNQESNEAENRSVGLFISKEEGKNNFLTYYTYPYNIEELNINIPTTPLKTILLQDGIRINYLSGYNNLLFFYDSIDGNLKIYTFLDNGYRKDIEDNKIEINYSYLNSDSASLQKKLTYFRNTNIIDYE